MAKKKDVIGGPGLVNALYDAGITMNDVNPDYVVVGETNSYNYNMACYICTAYQNECWRCWKYVKTVS